MKRLKVVNKYEVIDGEPYVNGISAKHCNALQSEYEEDLFKNNKCP